MKKVSMARKKKAEKELQPNIKVRLDYKTVITIKDENCMQTVIQTPQIVLDTVPH